MLALKRQFGKLFPDPSKISLVPVMEGGKRVGKALSEQFSIGVNPMRMSYYDEENRRREKPECLALPDIRKIIVEGETKPVVFAEGVVESQETLLEAIRIIKSMVEKTRMEDGLRYGFPEFYVFALVSKINGEPNLPNFYSAFKVNRHIWVHGWGVDNGNKGRELGRIDGVLSPFAGPADIPQPPYYAPTEIFLAKI